MKFTSAAALFALLALTSALPAPRVDETVPSMSPEGVDAIVPFSNEQKRQIRTGPMIQETKQPVKSLPDGSGVMPFNPKK